MPEAAAERTILTTDGAQSFRLPVRVYYEDTDAGGVVYHANYLRYAERARTEMLRSLGVEQTALREDQDLVFVVRRCEMDFRAPARLDDALDVRTDVIDLKGATIVLQQSVFRDGDAQPLVVMVVTVATIRTDGCPSRVPPRLAALMRSGS